MRATVSLETLRAAITTAMRDANGHVPIAAKALGVSRRTLARWLVQLPEIARAPRGFHIAKKIPCYYVSDARNMGDAETYLFDSIEDCEDSLVELCNVNQWSTRGNIVDKAGKVLRGFEFTCESGST